MKNQCVKILDCTLRDGGYVNDWYFGEKNIKTLIENLHNSSIDYIECGFLKECCFNKDKTFFSSILDLEKFVQGEQKYTLMVNYGEYSITNFTKCLNKNIKIRLAFKKHNQKKALEYIKDLKDLGWDVFANPMITNTYSKDELEILTKELNQINPYGVSIVDTFGNMYERDVIEIFKFFDKKLHRNIALAFHSHNSLQLSFSNTKALLKLGIDRELIIDSCLYGMGRGAGNLCTELITKYMNDNFKRDYKIDWILKSINEIINPIYQESSWGYSTPFYIAAINSCHPNYAVYLVQNHFSDVEIDKIIGQIPIDKKNIFDENFISGLAKK